MSEHACRRSGYETRCSQVARTRPQPIPAAQTFRTVSRRKQSHSVETSDRISEPA